MQKHTTGWWLVLGGLLYSSVAAAAALVSGENIVEDSSGSAYHLSVKVDGDTATVVITPCKDGRLNSSAAVTHTVKKVESPPVETWNNKKGVTFHESSRGGHIFASTAHSIQDVFKPLASAACP